ARHHKDDDRMLVNSRGIHGDIREAEGRLGKMKKKDCGDIFNRGLKMGEFFQLFLYNLIGIRPRPPVEASVRSRQPRARQARGIGTPFSPVQPSPGAASDRELDSHVIPPVSTPAQPLDLAAQ
ncbi:hypothetical protein CEP52_000582, partial [Fusarium oligoseptatum]